MRLSFDIRDSNSGKWRWYRGVVRVARPNRFTMYFSVSVLDTSIAGASLQMGRMESESWEVQNVGVAGTVADFEGQFGVQVGRPQDQDPKVVQIKKP